MKLHTVLTKGLVITAAAATFLLAGCSTTFNTLSPEITSNTREYSFQEKMVHVNGTGYVMEDTAGWKANFKVSSIEQSAEASGIELSISPALGIHPTFDYTGVIYIESDADSSTLALLYMFNGDSWGASSSTDLGDTVLIFRDNVPAGHLIYIHRKGKGGHGLLRPDDAEIVLDGTTTLVHHEMKNFLELGNESYAFYRGDALVASIGNAYRPAVGQLKYHLYVKNIPGAIDKLDVIRCYLFIRAYRSFRSWQTEVDQRARR